MYVYILVPPCDGYAAFVRRLCNPRAEVVRPSFDGTRNPLIKEVYDVDLGGELFGWIGVEERGNKERVIALPVWVKNDLSDKKARACPKCAE